MIDPEGAIDILWRIDQTWLARCGQAWAEPPLDWPDIVRRSWPTLWYLPPAKIPDGWCDLIMAMSQHLVEIAGDRVQAHDAYEDRISGQLILRCSYDDEEVHDIVQGYEQASLSICTVCGSKGKVRYIAHPSGKHVHTVHVRCERHAS